MRLSVRRLLFSPRRSSTANPIGGVVYRAKFGVEGANREIDLAALADDNRFDLTPIMLQLKAGLGRNARL